jgi:large subunit ribosomal protein L18
MEETLMAKGSNYRVKLRRRREGKTDYQARKALVVSGKPRLVARTANRNITVQISIAKSHGDEVLAAANSRELLKSYGWKAATGNIPAAYLTGLLCGFKAKTNGIKEAILDIGLVAPTKGAKIFAALSGVLDAGVDVPHSEEKIVKERMKGEHIAKYAKSLGAGSEEYNAKFSKYNTQGVAPEKISEHFAKVKATITDSFKTGKQVVPKIEKEAPAEKVPEKKVEKAAKVPEKTPAAKKPAAKKPAAKKQAVKEEAPAKEERASAKKAAKPKAAAKEPTAPKEKTSKKGGRKA